ncbi:efflux RND transporter periplasmic adaptor subunit [Sphingobacterium sp. UT-1RO-CII-1]|uniref:efflux RND transporter periplasmic adaptor subunit n=1 Tax=Sphingobacterium sp. UT-1RO-CII-1 TaxID=2995225 RepID=UPI00227A3AA0|nr:efflux RND transporter periplasmic adaptor subunit [Sphingobacterium sp. UT-1RO-CII-1]MCY4778475.1 efflux RND transporter periplasmic adaptor subunit [Sphingobacterium sp. UT-1RO-CII-1]
MKSISLMFGVVAIGLFVSNCTVKSTETKVETARQVPIVGLTVMDTTIYKEYIADIQASKNVELRSRLSGFLERIYVDEGATVRAGQTLFKLNDEEYKADFAKAEAALNIAIAEAKKVELEKERTKKLVEKNIVSTTERDLIQVQYTAALSKVEEAKAVLNQARTKLGQTSIKAPFDGRIDRILLKEGSLLEEGALITSISDLNALNVYFDISEAEYLALATDSNFNGNSFTREVKLILANGQEYAHKAIAQVVESEFQPTTGSISLRAKFPNESSLLKHGGSGKIGVPVSTGNTKFVHQKSVVEVQDKAYVYVLNADQTVKMQPFRAGQRVGHYYIVEDGLNENDKIVFEGVQGLRDGMKVTPKTQN